MKTKILCALREADGFLSGQELCQQFGVSRTAVWKAINGLRQQGYEIEAVSNRGYRILSSPDLLTENEISSKMQCEWAGCKVIYMDEVDSTNNYAKVLGEQGEVHGTLVVADVQTAGKGRRGRYWVTPKGSNISMSLLMRPDIMPANASMLTLVMGLAVQKALQQISGISAQIKWPNDLVVHGCKVCGILTEMSAQMDEINYIVIGVGINVNNEDFPEDCKDVATSIRMEVGHACSRADIIAEVMRQFEKLYQIFLKTQDLSGLVDSYNSCLVNEGKQVRVIHPKQEYDGIALGINDRGELMVSTGEAVVRVDSGEVSVRGVLGYV